MPRRISITVRIFILVMVVLRAVYSVDKSKKVQVEKYLHVVKQKSEAFRALWLQEKLRYNNRRPHPRSQNLKWCG